MTVPERISDFLSRRRERRYCDTCIQERLGLKWRQQVQLITATLGVTTGFRRAFDRCCTCQEIKQVTHAVSAGPRGELPRSMAGPWQVEPRFNSRSDPSRPSTPGSSGRGNSETADELSNDCNRQREQ